MAAPAIQHPLSHVSAAGAAFDQLAAEYDRIFTESFIGRAQRNAVWKVLMNTFKANDKVLELNCGTGEDALFLARRGISVFACDASGRMIGRAEQRLNLEPERLPIVFCQLPTERIGELRPDVPFDGTFSNFSGLNCVADLGALAGTLSGAVKLGGRLLLCFSSRFCLIEIGYYLFRGQAKKALRRCKGNTIATLGNLRVPVYYPTLSQIRRDFAPHFELRSCRGIGVVVPPSYCESWAQRHRKVFRRLCRIEDVIADIPVFRVMGDHVLLCLERVSK